MADPATDELDAFIERWTDTPLHERANYQAFVSQLCRLIGVEAPGESRVTADYTFDAPIRFRHDDGTTSSGFIDCYKRGCFVLEAKQSRKADRGDDLQDQLDLGLAVPAARPKPGDRPKASGLDRIMRKARVQAEGYAKALDEWPPFLVIVDVGNVIELYADFARQGETLPQFPDRQSFRIRLGDLRDAKVRERLKAVWDDPMSLDPAARAAEATTDIAKLLARASRSMEARCPKDADATQTAAWAGKVAGFLMQCIFAMFAEDVDLLPDKGFQRLIEMYRGKADRFHLAAAEFFSLMDRGGHNAAIQEDIKRFNGGLFRDRPVVEVTEEELEILRIAAGKDWKNVEPAIFGALLEQALDPRERASLGAHYTPRAYVEQLVAPTVIEPLRADWEAVQAAAAAEAAAGDDKAAHKRVRAFHEALCRVRVLDPACGTGNFLYVALELMKAVEGEVLDLLRQLGEPEALALSGHTVDPHQFLGLEKNPRAAAIAELVLWVGHLQWWFRTFGRTLPAEPILKDFGTIRVQDALLVWDRQALLTDEQGRPVTRQDPEATKLHPITGEVVPDPDKRLEQYRYVNPRPAAWPEAEFIVGNPPFIGGKDLRRRLGDGYAEALWASRKNRFRSADLVIYWWDRAAELLTRPGTKLRRFGFVTTNSLTQTFSRRVLEAHMGGERPVRLAYAVPDHPWVKGAGRAAVRIAMTVAEAGAANGEGRLLEVTAESGLNTDAPVVELGEVRGAISADLTVGADVTTAVPLRANAGLAHMGVKLHGDGFIVTPAEAAALGLGRAPGLENLIRPFRNGRDLADRPRGVLVIDLFGMSEAELRRQHTSVYQRVLERVKPERGTNNRATYRDNWWVFGEPRRELRPALDGLTRYIATVRTAKHRLFQFVDPLVIAESKLVVVASDDLYLLGSLSSRHHVLWATQAGGWLGMGNDPTYNHSDIFDPFPFPDATPAQRAEIGALAEELDALRKAVIAEHGFLTMTKLYNVREKLVREEALTDAERAIYEAGKVGVIHHLHQRIDAAVAEAYGWPADLADAEVLERLVALNRERAAEEKRGLIRWLRPDYQAPRFAPKDARAPEQTEAVLERPVELPPLPTDDARLAGGLLQALRAEGRPADARRLAGRFRGADSKAARSRINRTLHALSGVGLVRREGEAWFAPRRAT